MATRTDAARRRGWLDGGRGALLLAALLAAVVPPAPAAAASPVFGTPTATSTYGTGIDFRQPVTVTGSPARAELLVEAPRAAGPQVYVVDTPAGGSAVLHFTIATTKGELLPNTTLTARWRVVGQDGATTLGPTVTVRYDDTRFTWQTRTGPIVRVHWYQGGSAFGDRALQIGEAAIQKAGRLLGVTETEPVDFFIYADQQAFYQALGPGTRENVGGEAIAGIRTLFALITPAEIEASWVGTVIPHELTHLVFDTAVRNPFHFPPRWLNEGLAVYLAQGYGAGDRAAVESAVRAGTLMPLSALTSQFPTTRERFSLAYAESVAAVDYLIRQKGEAGLVALIRSYAAGVTDDEAFRAALGVDVAGMDAAWRATVGAKDPVAYGPVPAPSGPVPDAWLPFAGGGSDTAPQVGTSVAPTAPSGASTGTGTGATGSSNAELLLTLGGVLLLAVGVGIGLLALAARTRPGRQGPRDPGGAR